VLTVADRADAATLVRRMTAWRADWDIEGYLLFGSILLLSIVFFRGVLSAILPLTLMMLVAGAASGVVVLAALAFGFDIDPSLPQLITTVLIGIGIDYFLFMVFRFRERLRLGESRKVAARDAAIRVSPVVASAALAIVVAFAALGLAKFGQFRVLGPSVAIAVLVMLLAGITLVPALLAATGKKLFALEVVAARARGWSGRTTRCPRRAPAPARCAGKRGRVGGPRSRSNRRQDELRPRVAAERHEIGSGAETDQPLPAQGRHR
jgi:putative drug exporter of the RND superfamily